MWLNLLIELPLAITTLFLGINLWALIKSPSHLIRTISDESIIKESLNIIGSENFINEAGKIETAPGGHKLFMDTWETSRRNSLSITRNLLLIPYLTVLIISGYVGFTFLIINISISLLLYFQPINAYAINNNMIHIHTVMLHIYKWNTEDTSGCENYCTFMHPEYLQIYKLIKDVKYN
jgi:hypothetical protein